MHRSTKLVQTALESMALEAASQALRPHEVLHHRSFRTRQGNTVAAECIPAAKLGSPSDSSSSDIDLCRRSWSRHLLDQLLYKPGSFHILLEAVVRAAAGHTNERHERVTRRFMHKAINAFQGAPLGQEKILPKDTLTVKGCDCGIARVDKLAQDRKLLLGDRMVNPLSTPGNLDLSFSPL